MGTCKIAKAIAWGLIILICLWLASAHAQYVDLKGGDVLEQGRCIKDTKPYVCVVVRLDAKVYVVLLDRKGEYEIYLVTEKESVLIWYRDWV